MADFNIPKFVNFIKKLKINTITKLQITNKILDFIVKRGYWKVYRVYG